jgi:MFS family permease
VGGNLVALIVGAVMIGLSSFVPTFVEGVIGTGALVAGFTLAALTIGWPISASMAGHIYLRIGFRDTALAGSVFVVAGTALTAALTETATVWHAAAAAFVIGIGLGLVASPTMIAGQSSVGWDQRGVVTGANMFCRSLGSAVGAAVFGAIANATLAARFAAAPPELAGRLPAGAAVTDATSQVLGGQTDSASPVAAFVRSALYDATHHVFLAMVVVAVLTVAAVLLVPRRTGAVGRVASGR